MALTAYCPTCRRTVYLEDGDTSVCPVCSTALVAAEESADEPEPHPGGEK